MDALIQCSEYARFIEPFMYNRDNQDSPGSSIMMLTTCGVGKLMELSIKFTEVIFKNHEWGDFDLPGKTHFSCAFDKFAQRSNVALYANLENHHVAFLENTTDSITRSWCLLLWRDCSFNREGLLNKLHDYRDCPYKQAEGVAAPRLMYVRISAFNAHHGQLRCTYHRCKLLWWIIRSGDIIKKKYFRNNKYNRH